MRAWVGLEHLLYCTPDAYRGAIALADEFGTEIHTHSSEQQLEVDEVVRQFGRRPSTSCSARRQATWARCGSTVSQSSAGGGC